MFRLYRLLKRLKQELSEANSLSEGESQHIERSLNKTLGELLQMLLPLNQVKVSTRVPVKKVRETWSYTVIID